MTGRRVAAARRRIALAALAVALVAAAVIAPGAGATQQPRSARDAIQQLLDERARAWLRRDELAWLATVSRSHRAFYERQRRLFRAAASVPFASYRLVARWDRYGDLATPGILRAYPGAERVAIPLTEERYRIRGFDPQPAVEEMFDTFVLADGEWRVGGDADLEDVGLASARHAWDFGPVATARSAHFMVVCHPGSGATCSDRSAEVLRLAEQALERVERYWDAPWNERVVIVEPRTTAELGRILQTTFDLDNFVAFAASTVDPERNFDYVGHRVLFNPSSIATRSAEEVTTILAHELLHVATRPVSGPFIPVFVDEGIAEYVGHDASPSALAFFDGLVAQGRFDARLPDDVEFLTGSGTDIYTSYQEAQSAVRFFVQRYGWQRLERFYRLLGRPRIAPGTTRYHVNRALRASVGTNFRGFQRAWATSIGS